MTRELKTTAQRQEAEAEDRVVQPEVQQEVLQMAVREEDAAEVPEVVAKTPPWRTPMFETSNQ
jgi:hypothetical protein